MRVRVRVRVRRRGHQEARADRAVVCARLVMGGDSKSKSKSGLGCSTREEVKGGRDLRGFIGTSETTSGRDAMCSNPRSGEGRLGCKVQCKV